MRINAKVHGRRKYARRKVRRRNIVNNCKSVYIHGKVYDFSKLRRYPNNNALSFKDLWFPLFIRLEKRCPVKQCPKRKQQKKKESATHSSKSTSDPPTSTNDTPNSTPALLSSGPETHPTSVERVPSKRGEHIINQDVLKVERKIFQEFLGKLWVDKSEVSMSVQSVIRDNVKKSIEKDLVVMFDNDDEGYIEKNSGPYGEIIKDLRDAVVTSMLHYWQYVESIKNVRTHVGTMITNEEFVDKQALNKWCETNPTETFDLAKEEVTHMFRNLDRQWIEGVVHELDECLPDCERYPRPPPNPLGL